MRSNLSDKCIFDAGLFTGTQMAERNAFLAEAERERPWFVVLVQKI